MPIKKLFNSSIQSENRTYLLIRDDSRFVSEKDFIEEGWRNLSKYLDPNFETKIAEKFHEHFWELYLGLTLQNLNFELVPKEKQTKKRQEGPDFCVILGGKNLWIEATIADIGTKVDKVPEPIYGQVNKVPEEQILLRLTNSISYKNQKLQKFLSKGIIRNDDLFVIGINSFLVTKLSDTEIPYIVKSVFGYGKDVATISLKTLGIINRFYEDRQYVIKKNLSPVSTSPFTNGELPGISGIIYSNVDIWNLPASLGSDFKFVHNPTSYLDSRLQQGWMPIGQEYSVEGDMLKVKQYNG
jgi:hypothetical protein